MGAKPKAALDDANRPNGPNYGANGAAVRTPSLTETTPQFGSANATGSDGSVETETARSPALYTGMVVDDRFVIVRQLGAGGMGEVYEAQDLLGRELIALKTIRGAYASRAGALERFQGEVRLGASISHPNLCPMRSIFVWRRPAGDLWYFTMKLLSGETLARRLDRFGQLAPQEAIAFAKGIASALDALHDAGLVHRDLKPSNIFLEETRIGEKAVVTDFGLARSYSEGAPLTEAGRVPGTPSYIAPEVLAGGQSTPAADVYSFGVVLHEMLFAHRPESATTTEVRAGLPGAKLRRMRGVVSKCLDRDPDRRFARAGAAVEALEAAFENEPITAITRRRMLIGSGAAALVAAGSCWTEREQIGELWENVFHPIPRPRHVAVMPADTAALKPEEASLLGNVLETVGSELARAETSERDLFVVLTKYLQDQKVQTIPQAVGLFGANLVLTAAVRRAHDLVHLTLRVMDTGAGKVLRSSTVSCATVALFTLPELAANRAATLLDISRRDWSSRGTQGGTTNGEAYAAYSRGEELLRSDEIPDTEKAIVQLQKAVELDAHFALAFAGLGEGYAQEYRLTHDPEAAALARRNSQKALDLAPNVAACRRSRAVIEKMQGDYEGEIADLRVAMQLDPQDAEARLLLAQAYASSGNQERADATFEALLREHPNYWLALTEWGKIYWRHAKYRHAMELFRQASLIAPAAALPYQLLGGAYLSDEQFEKSEQASKRSINLLRTGPAYSNLATAQFWLSDYLEAASSYQMAVQLAPERYDCWLNLGDCWYQLGRRANAEAAWQEAVDLAKDRLEVNAKDLETTVDLALLKAKLGEAEASKRLLRTASSLGTPDAEILFAEVKTYELAGERDSALKLLQRCAAQGYSRYEILHTPELQGLRKDPRFKSLGIS